MRCTSAHQAFSLLLLVMACPTAINALCTTKKATLSMLLLLLLLLLLAPLRLMLYRLLLLLLLTNRPLAPAHVKVRLVGQRKVVQRACSGTTSRVR
jgi:hypothetical protein